MKQMLTLAIALILGVVALASPAMADVPSMISYQGQLTDAGGAALDTTVSMEFAIYDDSTGGVVNWSEAHMSITVEGGSFTVTLGTFVPIDDSVFNQPDRWLGITVGSDPELSPRTPLVSAGYAHRVSTVDGSTGGTISGDVKVDGTIDGEVLGMPGITSQNNTSSVSLTLNPMQDLETVTITTPTEGYIVLLGQCNLRFSGTTGPNGAVVQIDENAGGGALAPYYAYILDNDYISTTNYYNSAFCQRVYGKSAGTYTFRLEAARVGIGNVTATDATLTAMFYPTNYGTVETVAGSSQTELER